MRDIHIEMFIDTFGEGTLRTDVDDATLQKWRGVLPDQLLAYWQQEGWCCYGNGLFWTIDPAPYEDVVQAWLENTPLARLDTYQAIARTAFGDLFLCGQRTGPVITLSANDNGLHVSPLEFGPRSKNELNADIRDFFGSLSPGYCDLAYKNGELLFDQALRKLGPLAADEAYGLQAPASEGGARHLSNLKKTRTVPYLQVLRVLKTPGVSLMPSDLARLEKALDAETLGRIC